MSTITTFVKTLVKIVYNVIKLIGVLGEGVFKLSSRLNDCLVTFDDKITKEFNKKKNDKNIPE